MTHRPIHLVRCTSPPLSAASRAMPWLTAARCGTSVALAATALLAAAPALAQADATYWYGGLSAGSTRGNFDEARIASQVLGAGTGITSTNRDGRSNGYRLFGGYQMSPNFAVEVGYHDLGKFGFNATTVPTGTLNGEMKFVGASFDLLGMLPVTENLSVLARAGMHWTRTRDRFSTSGAASVANPTPSRRTNNGKYGLGLQYAFTPSFLMRAEAERYRANSATGTRGDINVLSLSLVFPIGRGATRMASSSAPGYAAAPAPMPEPIAAPPPPAPMPAPLPIAVAEPAPRAMPAPRRRVSYSAESVFGFDQSLLQAQGKLALDTFVNELRGADFDSVVVEGHTDRLGSTAYNQSLSQRRADAVKAYLVDSGGVAAQKVSAKGMGESAPLPQTADCKADQARKALIACLQPDRRVDIEVVGTR
jgi:OOP family OmpA-OmpF porin